MAIGKLSTLGLGSQGALNNDIIDKLKDADKSALVTPIENRLTAIKNKSDELAEVKKLMLSLSTTVSNLTLDEPYNSVKTDLSGSSVKITTDGKVGNRSFSIDVEKLATKDVFEANDGFSAKSSTLEAGDLKIKVGDGEEKTISIKDGDTIEDLVKNINEQLGEEVEASLLNVGGSKPYKLIIKSVNTGEDNQLTISSTSNSFSNGIDRLGDPAQDAVFKLDGVSVTRSTNKIDDLVDNITINLEDTGKTEVSIKEDDSKIVDGIKDFVEKYNKLAKVLSADTKYDSEKKQAGIFQGNSNIVGIMRSLSDIVGTTVSKDSKMAGDFGLELQRDGTIKFDETKFQDAYKSNSAVTIEFFKASDASSGFFNKLEDKIFDISTSSNGVIKSYKKDLDAQSTRYEELKAKAEAKLNARYEILTKKFAAADALIGRLNSSSDVLQQMIEAQFAKN